MFIVEDEILLENTRGDDLEAMASQQRSGFRRALRGSLISVSTGGFKRSG